MKEIDFEFSSYLQLIKYIKTQKKERWESYKKNITRLYIDNPIDIQEQLEKSLKELTKTSYGVLRIDIENEILFNAYCVILDLMQNKLDLNLEDEFYNFIVFLVDKKSSRIIKTIKI